MLRSVFISALLICLLFASGSSTEAMASEQDASNIGFVLYTKSYAPGTLDARWIYGKKYRGPGIATGGPRDGFAGQYHVRYFYENISMIADEKAFFLRDAGSRKIIGKLDDSFVTSYLEPYTTFITHGRSWRVVKIEEVVVKSHKLIGVLVVDAKNVPKDIYSRIHINGLPQAYEIGTSYNSNFNSGLTKIFNPVDFWYKKIGAKPKELKRLRKLKEGDEMKSIMEQQYSREIMMDYLDMSRKELNDLLTECNYSNRFITKASDLQIIEAVLDCYENYRAIKKGTVKRDIIHIKDTMY